MPTRPKKLQGVLTALLALITLLVPTPRAHAAGSTLQVSREVNTVSGGVGVTLTATVFADDPVGTKVNFEIMDGPADSDGDSVGSPDTSCTVKAEDVDKCEVLIADANQGTSRIRAWIQGTTPDTTERRLANESGVIDLLNPDRPDCQPDDAPLLQTCDDGVHNTIGAGTQPEPDGTDVVEITWTTFANGRLDCDDNNPSDGEDVEYNNADQRSQTYICKLTTLGSTPRPIQGALIDGEKTQGLDANSNPDGADLNDRCRTEADGTCEVTVNIPAAKGNGSVTICFWAEPESIKDSVYNPNSSTRTDGGGCTGGNEIVDEPEANDLTDAVLLDIDAPRASRLNAGPETQQKTPNNKFSVIGLVYDQFGQLFEADTKISAELFTGSPLDNDGNTPTSPDFWCRTGTRGHCSITTPVQSELGTNLACFWLDPSHAPDPNRMIGDNLDGACEDEVPADPTGDADNQVPSPPTDGRDIVRFTIVSKPIITRVTPPELRQETGGVLRVQGFNFMPGARISISGSGVKVGTTRYGSAVALEADVNVAPGAGPGTRDVVVTNPDGGRVTCGRCFTVIGEGYWLMASDGGIFSFGGASFLGSTGSLSLNQPIVGMAATPTGKGYWLVSSDGGIFSFGDARFYGSTGHLTLARPIVGMAATPSGRGYWLVASDGGIFSFGDARFYGSTGRLPLARPIVGITASPSGRGYWLVASDGGIFGFGDARFYGSTGAMTLNQPIVGIAATETGKGYWLVASDGGIFGFGDARFYGSTGAMTLNQPIVGMAATETGKGYWLVASDGGIFAFGDAGFHGSTGDLTLNRPIVTMARR